MKIKDMMFGISRGRRVRVRARANRATPGVEMLEGRALLTVPTLSIGDVQHAEGDSGTTPFNFNLTLSQPSTDYVILVYDTVDGTATAADNDYVPVHTGVTYFNPGETSKAITVLVNGDTKIEPDETFSVHISLVLGATLTRDTAVGTILNDDGVSPPTISINDVTQGEGNSGTTPFTFTVTLSHATAQPVMALYHTVDGTATVADNDYTPIPIGVLTFNPGETSKAITVLVNGDTKYESDETFTVELTVAANATLAKAKGVGTIRNDDPAPPLGVPTASISDVTQYKGKNGTTPFNFNVTLSQPSTGYVVLVYDTVDGTATAANNDYVPVHNGVVYFHPGETSKTVTVLVKGNSRPNPPSETFSVHVSFVYGATLARDTAVGTILNDDGSTSSALGLAAPAVITIAPPPSSTGYIVLGYAAADGTTTAADGNSVNRAKRPT